MTNFSTDRAAGVLLGCAAGDALGAGYEFQRSPARHHRHDRRRTRSLRPRRVDRRHLHGCSRGRGGRCRARLALSEGLDVVAAGFARWYGRGPQGRRCPHQRRAICRGGPLRGEAGLQPTWQPPARARHAAGKRTAGNGALMRTAAVALAHLDDAQAAADAARAVSDLTHADPDPRPRPV